MNRMLHILAALIFVLISSAASQAGMSTRPNSAPAKKVEIDLISDVAAIEPGKPFWVGLRQRIAPHWHTYWKNPGDSGEPTHIKWTLPDGFLASEIYWPIPDVIPVGSLINYGYSDEVLLLTKITAPKNFVNAPVEIKATANWLVCEKICIPESGEAQLRFDDVTATGGSSASSPDAEAIANAVRALPKSSPWPVRVEVSKDKLRLRIDDAEFDANHLKSMRFFPDTWGIINISAEQTLSWQNGSPSLTLQRGELKDEKIDKLDGLLVVKETLEGEGVRNGFVISAHAQPISEIGVKTSPLNVGLWQALLFAFLGGAILNLMPCVFPVLSLKALTLARHGEGEMEERKNHGLAYLAGVLVSFLVFGFILIAVREAGAVFGWGFQFQSPAFVLAMAALFFALGLSLSGVFDIGTSVAGMGQSLSEQSGLSGSFFTGALASLASTPCTAPFMGAAMGFALTQTAFVTLTVFFMLGLGFAAPMTALSFSTPLARLLPKPGPWMETLKQVLAFPLYASAAWLVWVLSVQTGSWGVLAAAVVLICVGFVAWLIGSPGRASTTTSLVSIALLVVAGVVGYRLLDRVDMKHMQQQARLAPDPVAKPFSKANLQKYLDDGRTVFVNLTAAWCITCKVNEMVALSSERFRDTIRDRNIVYLKGDWTNRDPEITEILKEHGRAGVPLYLLFRNGASEPQVLPQILTESLVVRRLLEGSKSASADDSR